MLRPNLPRQHSALQLMLVAAAQALLIAGCMYVFLRGWRRDFHLPLAFSSDSLFYLMLSKGTSDNGWWWFNPMLGAPFGFNALVFPANSTVDQVIVWVISRFVSGPMGTLNLAWLSMVVLSGLSATWCMRRVGASLLTAVVAGTLFAVTPYALYRNIDHFGMVVYLVPFPAALAILVASGDLPERWYASGRVAALLAGCALIGLDYVYYAFFACFFFALAAIVGWLTYQRPGLLAAGALGIALIGGATLVNLAPSLIAVKQEGEPILLRYKVPAESEVYGLKVRQLISPAFQHAFPLFRWWNDKEAAAHFPIETENMISRLGVVGSVGFLGLLGLLFVPRLADRLKSGRDLLAASRLTIGAVLLATVGGFGSLFSLLVSPEIRAYNRIAPFIAFFSLAAVALAMDALLKQRRWKAVGAVIVLVLGLSDQSMATAGLNADYGGIVAEIPPLRDFVNRLEQQLPDRAMVLQLPFRTFLNDRGIARMQPYDHLKLYAVSHTIRWSYPAMSNEQARWQQAAAVLDPKHLPYQLAGEGFSAIVVDRHGYDDNGAAITSAVGAAIGTGHVLAETDRYIALDLRPLADTPEAAAARAAPLATRSVFSTEALNACGAAPLSNIDLIGVATSPLPASVSVPESGFKVIGWAVDQNKESVARGVDVVIDATRYPAFYGSDRADVAEVFKHKSYFASGFTADIPAGALAAGPHTLRIRVASSVGDCYYETPGVTIITN